MQVLELVLELLVQVDHLSSVSLLGSIKCDVRHLASSAVLTLVAPRSALGPREPFAACSTAQRLDMILNDINVYSMRTDQLGIWLWRC